MPGDRLTVETWWSVENRPPLDYSFGVFLINPGGVVVADSRDGPLAERAVANVGLAAGAGLS